MRSLILATEVSYLLQVIDLSSLDSCGILRDLNPLKQFFSLQSKEFKIMIKSFGFQKGPQAASKTYLPLLLKKRVAKF